MHGAAALLGLAILGAAGPGREPHGRVHPGDWGAELLRSPRALSVECEIVCVSAPRAIAPLGVGRILAGRAEGGRSVFAVALEVAGRPGGALAQISELEFGDRVSLRGRGGEHESRVALLLEGAKRLSRGFEKPPEPGSIEDALQGPFPFPGMLDLGQGRRFQGRVLGVEGQSLRVRASLAEIKVPLAELRALARVGGGTSFRPRDGRVDFLSSIERGGPEHELFSAAAELAWPQIEAKGTVRGTILRGLRMGQRFGLLVRSKDSGDLLLLLGGSRQARSGGGESSGTAQFISAASALKRGDEVVARVRKAGEDLVIAPGEDALLVADPREGLVPPSQWDDPEWRQIPPSRREALEAFVNALAEGPGPEAVLAGVQKLDPVSQRLAIKVVARSLDEGWVAQASVLKKLVEKIPAERLPPEVAHVALRGLFSPSHAVRVACAEMLGLVACREAPPVLAEAVAIFGAGERGEELRRAAEKAVERIKLAPPTR